jgi:hypothetical protein
MIRRLMYCGIFAQNKNCGAREKSLLGNGCVTRNTGVTVGSYFFAGSVLRLYTEDQLSL